MTRLAVLADIHGNSIALQAMLNDLDAQGGADYLIVLGDLAVFGPDPVGVLTLLQKRRPVFHVCRHTDRYLVEEQYSLASGKHPSEAQVLASFPWTAKQLGQKGLQFLADLPRRQFLSFSQEHRVMAVHGSPRSDEEAIYPEIAEEELQQILLEGLSCNLLLCAHTHAPFSRVVAGRRVVNVGSVGLPFDGYQGASYALVHLQPGGEYRLEFRRVAYEIEAVVDQLRAVGHPAAAVQIYNLHTARPWSESLFYSKERRREHIFHPPKPMHRLTHQQLYGHRLWSRRRNSRTHSFVPGPFLDAQ